MSLAALVLPPGGMCGCFVVSRQNWASSRQWESKGQWGYLKVIKVLMRRADNEQVQLKVNNPCLVQENSRKDA